MRWLLLGVLTLVTSSIAQEESCLSGDEYPYLLFGTKTAYTFSNSGKINSKVNDVLGCTPIAFWSLNRPGSLNPAADEIFDLQRLQDLKQNIVNNYRNENYRNTNQRMCPSDVNMLSRWQWNPRHNATFAGALTSDGYITTQQLAQAWRQKYPGLLTDNRHDYLFKHLSDQTSSTTFKAFTEGLFRAQAEGYDIPKQVDDKLLEPHKNCPAWVKDVEQNNDTLTQLYIFESKQDYKEMITNISKRLGFNYDVDQATVKRMYQMCRYNKAWDVVPISPWCAVFTKDDLKRLEYAEDLETFYKYGYGNELNQKVGCGLVKDMMNFFNTHVFNGEVPQQPHTVIQFSNEAAILSLHTALGAHRGVAPLTGDNYRTQSHSRHWTTSTMAPYNANIAAVLYRCDVSSNYQIKDQYQVLFLENEQQMNLEGCRVGLCDWALVKEKYGKVAENCDMKFCNSASPIKSYGIIITLLALIISGISTF